MGVQAVQKRHSTTEEALLLAARMGAYRVILTHFSSRYPKARPMFLGRCPEGGCLLSEGLQSVPRHVCAY